MALKFHSYLISTGISLSISLGWNCLLKLVSLYPGSSFFQLILDFLKTAQCKRNCLSWHPTHRQSTTLKCWPQLTGSTGFNYGHSVLEWYLTNGNPFLEDDSVQNINALWKNYESFGDWNKWRTVERPARINLTQEGRTEVRYLAANVVFVHV